MIVTLINKKDLASRPVEEQQAIAKGTTFDVRTAKEVKTEPLNPFGANSVEHVAWEPRTQDVLGSVVDTIIKKAKDEGSITLFCKSGRRACKVAQQIKKKLGEDHPLHIYVLIVNIKKEKPLFIQLFDRETCTYTYLIADEQKKEGVVIDSVQGQTTRDVAYLDTYYGITCTGILETHVHADHVTGSHDLNEATKQTETIPHHVCITAQINKEELERVNFVDDLDTISVGDYFLIVRRTPGHTNTCVSYVTSTLDQIMTGDALFCRGCGRTDFQSGSAKVLYQSIQTTIFKGVPNYTRVYPGHDYKGRGWSTVALEKKHNPRCFVGQTVEGFVAIMDNLNLNPPAKLAISLPGNRAIGNYKQES